jgi:DNA-binding IclR family transcriptional regulator
LAILLAFRPDDRPLSLAVLAKRTRLSKATLLRLAATLEQHDFLQRDQQGAFTLGVKNIELAMIYQSMIEPIDVIVPALRALSAHTGESVSFMVRQGDVRVCLYRVDSNKALRDHLRAGSILPLSKGAAGRIILAFSPPYEARYAALRQSGVDYSTAEITAGVASICAPIFDQDGLAGALALSGPQSRLSASVMKKMTRDVMRCAEQITTGLTGDPTHFKRELKRAARISGC